MMAEPLIIHRRNPKKTLVWEHLPLDLVRLIIVQSQNTVMFSVCKLFNCYSNDEDFWRNYASLISNNEFPPQHYNQDPRVAVYRVSSWKSYVRARKDYNRTLRQPMGNAGKRILRELKDINDNPPVGATATPIAQLENLSHWRGVIEGPEGTPYEGGLFYVDIQFPMDYPFKPPKVVFTTKIYHCDVNSRGNHCLSILLDNWSPALTISRVMTSLRNMIMVPSPDDPMDPDIATMYKKNRQEHDRIAREWTKKYAM